MKTEVKSEPGQQNFDGIRPTSGVGGGEDEIGRREEIQQRKLWLEKSLEIFSENLLEISYTRRTEEKELFSLNLERTFKPKVKQIFQ